MFTLKAREEGEQLTFLASVVGGGLCLSLKLISEFLNIGQVSSFGWSRGEPVHDKPLPRGQVCYKESFLGRGNRRNENIEMV